MDFALGYRDGQQRVMALVRSLDEDRLDMYVPLNPAWRVRDVVAHMVGVCEDFPMSPIRRGSPNRPESLIEQDPERAGYDASVRGAPPLDVGCHLHDLRHALDEPGDRDAPTTAIAFGLGRGWLSMRLDRAKSPALRMRSPDREWVIGHLPVGLTVAGDRFDRFRAITGRRSLEQLLALDWDADPKDFLDEIVPYPLPEKPVVE